MWWPLTPHWQNIYRPIRPKLDSFSQPLPWWTHNYSGYFMGVGAWQIYVFSPKIRVYYESEWVGWGLTRNFFCFRKSPKNSSKPVLIFWNCIPLGVRSLAVARRSRHSETEWIVTDYSRIGAYRTWTSGKDFPSELCAQNSGDASPVKWLLSNRLML